MKTNNKTTKQQISDKQQNNKTTKPPNNKTTTMTKIYALAATVLIAFIFYFNSTSKDEAKEGNETVRKELPTKRKPTGNTPAEKERKEDGVRYEIPQMDKESQGVVIEHVGHTLSYNKEYNTPHWSAWQLTREHTDGTVSRSSKFWADPAVEKAYRVEWYEYKESGYDRGHMCPAGDMKWSMEAMHDCFYMSNMCPQTSELNSGAWNKLEMKCREWAEQEGALYIVCGPIYKSGNRETIGIEHAIRVPDEFFKAVLSLRKGQEKAVAFIFRNDDSSQSYKTAATTVDHVEEITGLDLFHNLDDETEEKVEAEKGFVTK